MKFFVITAFEFVNSPHIRKFSSPTQSFLQLSIKHSIKRKALPAFPEYLLLLWPCCGICALHNNTNLLAILYSRDVQPAAWHSWQCSCSQPHAINYKDGGPSLVAPGMHSLLSPKQTISVLIMLCWLKPDMGRAALCCAGSVMAHNCVHFDTLAKHHALNSKEYSVMLSVW